MIMDYIRAALESARYDKIEDDEPFFGEIPRLKGVWASGKTLEECRHNLESALEGWILVRIKKGLPIPTIRKHKIEIPRQIKAHA